MSKIAPCLWFDGQAEEAAEFYTSLLPDSRIKSVNRAAADTPSGPQGSVLSVDFTLAGQDFMSLNGGPDFKFNEAVSLLIECDTQEEVDAYWERLSDGGEEGPCGWLKDRYGLSWQVVPAGMDELFDDSDPERAARAMQAMLQMRKLDIAALRRAADGVAA